MDPITAAIVATLPVLAAGLVKDSVRDAYDALKAVIRRKWGDAAPISKSIDALETDPKSKAQAAVLAEKVNEVKAAESPEVAIVLKKLLDALKAEGVGGKSIANIQVTVTGGKVGIAGAEHIEIENFHMDG